MSIFPASPRRASISPANQKYFELSAAAGASQATGTVVKAATCVVTVCASNGHALRLPSFVDEPALKPGDSFAIWNRTANFAALYPPSGKQIYVGGVALSANAATDIGPGQRVVCTYDKNGNYLVG